MAIDDATAETVTVSDERSAGLSLPAIGLAAILALLVIALLARFWLY